MSSIVVVGTQWGDEGKGKIVDFLAERADVVARFQGGSNAGHTVMAGGKVFKLHLLPSGILYTGCTCIIGNDVVLDPVSLLAEMGEITAAGHDVSGLRISDRAHVVMPWHKKLDALEEQFKGGAKVGTTGRGIGPCYASAASRVGIRVSSWMDEELFPQELRYALDYSNRLIQAFGGEPLEYEPIYKEYSEYAQQLRQYVCDTGVLINDLLDEDKKVLFEGAQAAMLDLSHGTYPFVTSSHPTAGAVCVGLGLGPHRIGKIIGVVKAYSTRVGEGPFPTEQLNEIGETIREIAHEYGATTGRPRRCGWIDCCVVRHAARINGLDAIAVTRVDILDNFDELKLCVGYRWNGQLLQGFPASLKVLEQVEPVYETMPGWKSDTTGVREYGQLPENCRRYLERIAQVSGARIGIVSVGADRDQTILCEGMF